MEIKFIKRSEAFYMNIAGAIYKQKTPFENVIRDWNNDGDEYAENVSIFELIGDENAGRDALIKPPKKLVLSDYQYREYLDENVITVIKTEDFKQ